MGFEVRVDGAGAVEIVRAAVRFGWSWDATDVRSFARRVGWATPEPVGTMRRGAVFSRTGLDIWWDSAMFWGSGRRLRYVRIAVSDCAAAGNSALLAEALDRVRAAFIEVWGEPESGAGPDDGPAWIFPNLLAGLAIGPNTVDLMLVNPLDQRFWMDKRHEAARRRAALGGWGRFTEDLADYLETLPTDARLVITAPGGRYVQFAVEPGEFTGELSRSEFIDPTWRYGDEVGELLIAQGWTPTEDANWRCRLPRTAGRTAVSHFAARAVEALRTLEVKAVTDLVADAWVEGGQDLEVAALGIPPHATARTQRAEFLRSNAPYGFDIGPLRVDIPSGIDIARAAREFDWSWTRADIAAFAERIGWQLEGEPGPSDRVVRVKTALRVDHSQARYCYDGDRLESVCITLSDSIESHLYEQGPPVEVREQLTAAVTRAVDALRAEFGTPVHGTIRQAFGPVWSSRDVAIGVVPDDNTVELHLVNPAERGRQLIIEQQQTARRAAEREWRQFFDDFAVVVAELPENTEATVDAGDRGTAHFQRDADGLRVRLDAEAGLGLHPRVTGLMRANGWQRPEAARPVWRHGLYRPALYRDFRHFVEFALWPLCTRMGPYTVLRVRTGEEYHDLRTPSMGATGF
ncbi:DUF6301 family protein [Nocardia acidivorans]|uniref:DUF6301 family protein n=1 Tax=Nocardia acidivorans TaxID=404580 RepID=UPI00082E85DD|nr:DUF6301 family protein [Nocardia acidivorans]